MPDKTLLFIAVVPGLAITTGAASIGTSIVSFIQNQILTANQHLLMALSDYAEATQNIVLNATNPRVSSPNRNELALDYLQAREGGGCPFRVPPAV